MNDAQGQRSDQAELGLEILIAFLYFLFSLVMHRLRALYCMFYCDKGAHKFL